jgi:hypothetical protein
MKQTIKLNETQLRSLIKESIKMVLKESGEKNPVFTVDGFDIMQEEDIDDMQITGQIYYSEEEAIEAARKGAKQYANRDDYGVILFTVYAGEYQLPSGDIYGEPYDIYTVSNSDKQTTMAARKQTGYVSLEVNEYVG